MDKQTFKEEQANKTDRPSDTGTTLALLDTSPTFCIHLAQPWAGFQTKSSSRITFRGSTHRQLTARP